MWVLYRQTLALLPLAQLWLSTVQVVWTVEIIIFFICFRNWKYKYKYLSSNLQEENLQIAVSGDRTDCQLVVLRYAWCTACRIYSCVDQFRQYDEGGFNISAVTKLQVLLIAVLQYITPAEQLQTAMILHYCTFPVRLPVKCNWWTNLSLTVLKGSAVV